MSSPIHNVALTSVPSATSSFEENRDQSVDHKDAPPTFEQAVSSSAATVQTETDVKGKKWRLFGKGKESKKEKKPKVVRPKLNAPRPGPLPVGNFYDRPLLRVL
ncbi:hypothetical protein BT69DRAFT_1340912 [Atractiella rhizophila]|nr:hypothetical protein BT69DRAFT_1340912 [Atractiella rhizophila]